jgi:hypothetical protein
MILLYGRAPPGVQSSGAMWWTLKKLLHPESLCPGGSFMVLVGGEMVMGVGGAVGAVG